MQFLALRPGLHSVDTLTIMDTEAEYTLNLRLVPRKSHQVCCSVGPLGQLWM